jgi:hypothetical protein
MREENRKKREKGDKMKKEFAICEGGWKVEDVLEMAENNNIKMTSRQAKNLLLEEEKYFTEYVCQTGNEYLEDIVINWGKERRKIK